MGGFLDSTKKKADASIAGFQGAMNAQANADAAAGIKDIFTSKQNTGTNPLAQPTLGDNPVALAMLAAKRKAAQSARAGTFLSGPRGDSLLPSLQVPTLLGGGK